MKKVAVIMGSDSDLPVVKPAIDTLKKYGVECEARILSAHRTPEQLRAFVLGARDAGFGVIIAAAGKAAHLAGSVAANTTLTFQKCSVRLLPVFHLDCLHKKQKSSPTKLNKNIQISSCLFFIK